MPRVKKEPIANEVVTEKPAVVKGKTSMSLKKEMNIDVYNSEGKVVESIELPEEVFGAKINKSLIAQAIRVYLANQRAGSASTLTRGEVTGSTRKIYRQKGTGRARHGGIRAPLFVGGGIAHGPRPKDFSLDLSKKMKKAAIIAALSLKRKDGHISVVAGLEKMEPKTKHMVQALANMKLADKKQSILFITDAKAQSVIRIVKNIKGVVYMPVSQVTTYDVMRYKTILFMKPAIDLMKERFTKKN